MNTSSSRISSRARSFLFAGATATIIVSSAMISPCAFAHANHDDEKTSGHHFVPKTAQPKLKPSRGYSGNTPVNRRNGVFFNEGTFGAPNSDYELWAKSPTWAVSLAERQYNYSQKERFLQTLDERILFYEAAIWNYSQVTDISKPEGKAHAESAATDLKPRIVKAREAWSLAKSSNRNEWNSAQDIAKRAFIEMQAAYYAIHKNVH